MDCSTSGLTVESIVVDEGYWRGSVKSVEVEDCVRRANCPGSRSGDRVGGDDLCGGHSKGAVDVRLDRPSMAKAQ